MKVVVVAGNEDPRWMKAAEGRAELRFVPVLSIRTISHAERDLEVFELHHTINPYKMRQQLCY